FADCGVVIAGAGKDLASGSEQLCASALGGFSRLLVHLARGNCFSRLIRHSNARLKHLFDFWQVGIGGMTGRGEWATLGRWWEGRKDAELPVSRRHSSQRHPSRRPRVPPLRVTASPRRPFAPSLLIPSSLRANISVDIGSEGRRGKTRAVVEVHCRIICPPVPHCSWIPYRFIPHNNVRTFDLRLRPNKLSVGSCDGESLQGCLPFSRKTSRMRKSNADLVPFDGEPFIHRSRVLELLTICVRQRP